MRKRIGYLLYIFAGMNVFFLILVTVLTIPGIIEAFTHSAATGAGYTTGLLLIWLVIGGIISYLIRTGRKVIRFDRENNATAKQGEV